MILFLAGLVTGVAIGVCIAGLVVADRSEDTFDRDLAAFLHHDDNDK
jgi:gas vesicle protein